jgi:hypothetical protein
MVPESMQSGKPRAAHAYNFGGGSLRCNRSENLLGLTACLVAKKLNSIGLQMG